MTKQWNGQTPYDGYRGVLESDRNDDPYLLGRADSLVEGYRAAMNSELVRHLYEAVRSYRSEFGCDCKFVVRHSCFKCVALARYEAGLREKP